MCGQHPHGSNETYREYVHRLKERLQHAHDVARIHLHDSAKRQKQIYNVKVKANQYEVRDLMWMETDIGRLDIAPKLKVPYKGPYMVWKRLGALDYEVHMFHGSPKILYHYRLKPYHGLKRPPGYYRAFAEAKRDGSQLLLAVESWRQRVIPVSQGGQLCRQKRLPDRVRGYRVDRREFLLSLVLGSPCRMAVLTHVHREFYRYRWINHVSLSQPDVPVHEV